MVWSVPVFKGYEFRVSSTKVAHAGGFRLLSASQEHPGSRPPWVLPCGLCMSYTGCTVWLIAALYQTPLGVVTGWAQFPIASELLPFFFEFAPPKPIRVEWGMACHKGASASTTSSCSSDEMYFCWLQDWDSDEMRRWERRRSKSQVNEQHWCHLRNVCESLRNIRCHRMPMWCNVGE